MHCQRNLLTSAIVLASFAASLSADNGIITTVAGNGTSGYAGVGGPATDASLTGPAGVAVDRSDNIYIASFTGGRVLRVDAASGILTLVAGNGTLSSTGDGGPATQASLAGPAALAFDPAGNLYISDHAASVIRRIDMTSGIITTVAGNGTAAFAGDNGPAIAASLNQPGGIAIDPAGNLYIADSNNYRIRRVAAGTGIITTIAGDGTPYSAIGFPLWVSLDASNNLLIVDATTKTIHRMDASSGFISNFAGNGAAAYNTDGQPATNAAVGIVQANVAVDAAGNAYFADSFGRIRRVDAATNQILTVAGNGGAQGQSTSQPCFPVNGENGPATAAILHGPFSVALTSNGNLIFSDWLDCRVRKVPLPAPLSYTNTILTLPGTVAQSQQVTMAANVTPINASITPTGSVQFVYLAPGVSPVVLGSAPLVNGSASLTITGPGANGTYPILGFYSGDSLYNPSGSPFANLVVANLATPTVTINPLQNPADLNAPTNIAVIVTQPDGPSSSSPAPTGTVQLYDGPTVVATGTLGPHGAFSDASVGLSVTFTTSGNHQLTANYLGDSVYRQAASTTINETVKSTPSVTLASNANPANAGATVTFTATVAPPLSDGTMRFTDGGNTIGTANVTNGVASLAVPNLAPGSHSIQAAYSGDNAYMPATSSVLTQTVSNVPVVTITANPVSSTFGQSVTFTVTVTPSGATGSVSLSTDPGDTFGIWGSFPLNGGSAVIPGSGIYAGSHNFTATYSGDSVYASAASTPAAVTVVKATPAVTLASATNPSMQGQYLALTATLSPVSNAATTVQFFDGASLIGSSTATSGTATYSAFLGAGHHSLTAAVVSNRDLNSATSPALDQTVQTNTAVNLQSPGPFVFGQAVTFTASLSSPSATGTVQFSDGATVLGTVTVTNPTPSITVSSLSAGPHTITAAYSGDGIYLPATGTLSITVSKATASATLTSSLNPSVAGQAVTLNATISPNTATGTVQFLDGTTVLGTATVSAGVASLTTSALAGGTHSLTAVYSGDANFTAATSPAVSQVVKLTTTTVVSGPSTSAFGQSVSLTASVTPAAATGTIQFQDGATSLGSATISGGSATLSISTLTVGAHSITATYSGDANNAGGNSAAFSLTITRAATSIALTSSANPSLAGQAVTLNVQVTPAAATGSVQILDGGAAIGTVTLVNGAGSITTSALAVGAHSLTAAYGGDASYDVSTSPALSQQVNAITTTVTLTASQNPALWEATTIFTATVTPAITYGSQPAGTVRLLDGTTQVGFANLTSGTVQFQVTFHTTGAHSMTAVYSGDSNFQGTTSATLDVTAKIPTTMQISAGPNPAVQGSTVTFMAWVQQAGASGTIELDDITSGTPVALGSVTSSNASATFSISNLSVGTHTIVANYLGDATHMSGTSASVTMVVKTATTGSISANPSLANPGQAIQFTFTVTPSAATGTVQFFDGATSIGTATVNNGVALLSVSTLSAGSHNVYGSYSGDNAYGPSNSTQTNIFVKSSSSAALGSSLNPSNAGQSVTFTVQVTPSAATGTVQLMDGGTAIGSQVLSNGAASFTTSSLAAGVHSLTAVYSGDGNYVGASSPALAQTIKGTTTTALSASSTTPTVGQSVTFTASVTPASATGSVQFLDGATVIGTAAVSGGGAAISTAALAVGSHSITAVYSGDGNDTGSTSAAVAVTVNKITTSTAVTSSLNPSISGQSVTFTATVSPSSATGSVQFKDGATALGTVALSGGSAAFSTSSLAIGSHSITAIYSGDPNDNGSTSGQLSQSVIPVAPSNLTATAPNNNTINLTWTASPTSGVTYNVYSSTNAVFTPSASNRIASGLTKTNFSNSGLQPATTHYYVVTAQTANGESAASNEASATTKGH